MSLKKFICNILIFSIVLNSTAYAGRKNKKRRKARAPVAVQIHKDHARSLDGALPEELLSEIASFSDLGTLKSLSRTNVELNKISKEPGNVEIAKRVPNYYPPISKEDENLNQLTQTDIEKNQSFSNLAFKSAATLGALGFTTLIASVSVAGSIGFCWVSGAKCYNDLINDPMMMGIVAYPFMMLGTALIPLGAKMISDRRIKNLRNQIEQRREASSSAAAANR